MDLLTSWRALRAAAAWVLAALVLGAVVGYLVPAPAIHGRPSTLGEAVNPAWGHFTATATLGVPPTANASQASTRVAQVAFYASSTAVVDGTLTRLKVPLTQAAVLPKVLRLSAKTSSGQLQVTGIGANPDQAAAIANAFSASLQGRVAAVVAANEAQSLAAATAQVATAKTQLDAAIASLAALGAAASSPVSAPGVELRARISALQDSYTAAVTAQGAARNAAASTGQDLIVPLQDARPQAATYVGPATSVTDRHSVRAVLGAAAGLVLAVLVVLGIEYRRPRVRGRAAAELAVGAPVIIELPRLRRAPADVAVRLAPASRSADAYRILRTVLLARPGTARVGPEPREVARAAPWTAIAQSVVVPVDGVPLHGTPVNGVPVHAMPVNGAAALGSVNGNGVHADGVHSLAGLEATGLGAVGFRGEDVDGVGVDGIGRSGDVAARSSILDARAPAAAGGADGDVPAFRWWRGQIVFLARPDQETSLATVAANVAAAIAETDRSVIVVRATAPDAEVRPADGPPDPRPTGVPGVSVVELDPRAGNDLSLTASLRQLAARADVVLIEGGSVLTEHTTASLAPLAEAVVLTLDAGHSTTASARDASRTLHRLGIPLRGVVLSGVAAGDLAGRHGSRRPLAGLRRG